MGRKPKIPVTPAVRFLDGEGVPYTVHLYEYKLKGGTPWAASQLGVDEHAVVKTLVMEDDRKSPMIVLMHGDKMVSTKQLARHIGVKHIGPCHPDTAHKHSGYKIGGTTPFATRKAMPVYMERSILSLPTIYINAGHRGFLLGVAPGTVSDLLESIPVNVAVDDR